MTDEPDDLDQWLLTKPEIAEAVEVMRVHFAVRRELMAAVNDWADGGGPDAERRLLEAAMRLREIEAG